MPPRKKKKPYVWLASTGVIILATALAWGPVKKKYVDHTPAVTTPPIANVQAQIDPLCQVVEGMQLKCLVAPAGEGVMGPGHYVNYPPDIAAHAKVPFSRGDLFDSTCVVAGVSAADLIQSLMAKLKAQEKTNTIKFDEITYKLDKSSKSGADLPIPKLPELKIKAGPNLSELQEISIKAPNAWLKIIDENRFINLLTEAAIKQSCIDDLIDQKYRVVSTSAIAQDYEITAKEKSGQSFALSAAIGKGELRMEGGGDAKADLDEIIKKASSVPVVVGVDFFDPTLIQKNRAKLVAPVFKETGQTRSRAFARGPRGTLWQTENSGSFGQRTPLDWTGGERTGGGGACGGGGSPSRVQLTSSIAISSQGPEDLATRSYEFTTSGVIAGGLSRSIAQGCQLIPNNVQADISFDSTVKTTVRSDTARTLQVEFELLQSPTAEVRDWDGKPLTRKVQEVNPNPNIQGFNLTGAGVYEVHVTGTRMFSAIGPDAQNVNERDTFKISVQ
jgi:hypothetical protein